MDNTPSDSPGERENGFWGNPIVRIAIYWIAYLAITHILDRLILALPPTRQLRSASGDIHSFSYAYWYFWFPLPGTMGALTALWLMRRKQGESPWRESGFVTKGLLPAILIGLLMGLAIQGLAFGITSLTEPRIDHRSAVEGASFSIVLVYGLLATLLAALDEQTIFCGFILQEFEKKWGSFIALAGTTLLVSLYISWSRIYLLVFSDNSSVSRSGIDLFHSCLRGAAAGLFFSSAFLYGRTLWLPIAAYMAETITLLLMEHFGRGLISPDDTALIEVIASVCMIALAVRAGQWKSGKQPLPASEVTQSEGSEPPLQKHDGK